MERDRNLNAERREEGREGGRCNTAIAATFVTLKQRTTGLQSQLPAILPIFQVSSLQMF
jgi:hypothetical protein